MSNEAQSIAKILKKIAPSTYEIDVKHRTDMRVPACVFIHETLLDALSEDRALWQLINMTTLPGIKKAAFAMPDIHQGYGFPIGGVAAMAVEENGVISPGGIGYDINCGVRLLASNLSLADFEPHREKIATKLFAAVPSGVGVGGSIVLDMKTMNSILKNGARAALELGYGNESDLHFCQGGGVFEHADESLISEKAKRRALDQLGTLGSGNHFAEIQVVDTIFDAVAAKAFGLSEGKICVMIHCGSRGLGHQTCTDYVRIMNKKYKEWGYELPDRELIYAPFNSPEGQDYFHAMGACANFAWANRHLIGHHVRQVWENIFGHDVPLRTVYDISHNIGTLETHDIDGKAQKLLLHRKGATRAFPRGHGECPEAYREVGHPVLIPGTMGTASYVLVGTRENSAFFSSCHGAGRQLSRTVAKKRFRGSTLREELERRGIAIRSESDPGLAEEAPLAYKDIDLIIQTVSEAKLATPVARLRPLAVIKG